MCIRDSQYPGDDRRGALVAPAHGLDDLLEVGGGEPDAGLLEGCLLYTSDAADERSSVDLGGRRIFKKKKTLSLVRGRRALEVSKEYISVTRVRWLEEGA